MKFQHFLLDTHRYTINDIDLILDTLTDDDVIYDGRRNYYYNVPCAFDIETTSFYERDEKRACMYVWMFGIGGAVIVGRSWDEFSELLETISERLELSDHKRLLCFVHNLEWEFQFIRHRFTWNKVFSIDTRKPLYALSSLGIEFRCSYLLSGYGLAKLSEKLKHYPIPKMVGDLDYSLSRFGGDNATPLTEKEWGYCINDVRVVMSYEYDEIIRNGDVSKIPLTKTGYVRRYVRERCFGEKFSAKYNHYRGVMSSLRITSADEYYQLKRAFQGGFTHACSLYSDETLTEVSSDDFTSSYPAQIVAKPYPMSSAELVEIKSKEQFEYNISKYCCIFDVEFVDLEPLILDENYISISRCYDVIKPVINNGRLVSCARCKTTITEQDWHIIKRFYKWSKFGIGKFRRYRRGYLPTDFVKSVLDLYKQKTELKGITGKEYELMWSKELLNACYGMMVTDIIRDLITYDNETEWGSEPPNIETALNKYNKSYNRFTFYPWGVYVCAYARVALFTGILEFITGGETDPDKFTHDYVYSDTDSIKGLNRQNHEAYINKYNESIRTQLCKAMDFHKLPYDMIEPKNIKGVPKCLGVWDFEGYYSYFKTLGAKRYMVNKDGEWNITVSGLNKKVTVPYLVKKYGDKCIDYFTDDLVIPAEHTGKNTHTYIDEETSGVLVDYLGNIGTYHEYSSIHLEGAEYCLSIAQEYRTYLNKIKMEM